MNSSSALYAIFFVSGSAALLFETLWFRLAALAFGNSVWASSLVLASFMSGLALGNGLASRWGPYVMRPARVYALLEMVVAATGLGLVLVLPELTTLLAPLFRPFLDRPLALNAIRLALSFGLLLVPATAMGATLPVLVRGLMAHEPRFGRALGRLYGWNTLGAVAGALAGETLLIGPLGIRGTGIVAALLNLAAARSALLVSRSLKTPALAESRARAADLIPWSPAVPRLLAAAFVSGGILLSLEVVWFRFLLLFVHGTSLVFAVMLSVVLLGIAAGGLAASWWFGRDDAAHRHLPTLALSAGFACFAGYAAFDFALPLQPSGSVSTQGPAILPLSIWLMLPVSMLSGLLFTALGRALNTHVPGEARAAGLLTLANSVGAALGSVFAGFVLLPTIGMEASFFALSLAYGGLALLTVQRAVSRTRSFAVAAAAFVLAAALFPFGTMKREYFARLVQPFAKDGSRIVVAREGLTETLLYLRRELWGVPVSHRLLTNSYSMSGTHFISRRYMKVFVYWPMAFHPRAEKALLISYGVGGTAKALTDTASLRSIDVVDTSRDILELSDVVFPSAGSHPLRDPRVRVHVEDGRFFLLTTDQSFDLITGEPPPPKTAGIVNLYSREFFELVRMRLAEGGIVTYWLPVYQLEVADTKAILKAFCSIFEDCSLWTGSGPELMMVGSRGLAGPVSEHDFERQWREPVAQELSLLGLERPEQLGALFVADSTYLAELTSGHAPLVDDHPQRVSSRDVPRKLDPFYRQLLDTRETRRRFERSALVRRLLPEALRERTLEYFDYQRMLNDFFGSYVCDWGSLAERDSGFPDLHRVLTRTSLESLPFLLLYGNPDERKAVDAAHESGAEPFLDLGLRAFARRDYLRAERYLRGAQDNDRRLEIPTYHRILALSLAGSLDAAKALAREAREQIPPHKADRQFWAFLERTFGIADPYSGT